MSERVRVPARVALLLRRIGRLAETRGIQAYAVGGCVRDWLLGHSRLVDVDVCVEGDGIAFARAAATALKAGVVVHDQFGTATLTRPRRGRIDVAGCRRETYREPAAYPKVAPGTLRDDLCRRDFTINAMAMSVAPGAFGRLVDEYGGLRDLRAKRLRVLHPNSFFDDPSRILRAARFAPRYRLVLEPKTTVSLRQAVASGMLSRLNRGRLRKELLRMLEEPDPVACFAQLGQWLASVTVDDRQRAVD